MVAILVSSKRDWNIVSESNALLICHMCRLSGLDWYIKDEDGLWELKVRVRADE